MVVRMPPPIHTPIKRAKIKPQSKLGFGKDVEEENLSYSAGWPVNGTTTLKNYLAVFAKDEYMHTWKTNNYNYKIHVYIYHRLVWEYS